MIAGIDPGLTGALFFLDPHSPTNGEAVDLPIHLLVRGGKKKRELDVAGLVGILAAHRIEHAFVEAVSSMPNQGVSSSFAFGKCFGAILGCLASHAVPLTLVSATAWKKALQVPKAKDGSRARASQLIPEASSQWALKKHHGRAEACLLAIYGCRLLNSTAERK
jgi:crossover junction endodeoxyribonuclease RuvC